MGISYDNYLVYGICLNKSECEVIISPAKYEMQNRYDTKTGKIIKQEKVCIKREENKYVFNSWENEDFTELANDIANANNLKWFYNYDDSCFIGLKAIESDDKGGARMIDGSISISELTELHNKMLDLFPFDEDKLKLYGVASIG